MRLGSSVAAALAAFPIRPLVWELSYVAGVAVKRNEKKGKGKKGVTKKESKQLGFSTG